METQKVNNINASNPNAEAYDEAVRFINERYERGKRSLLEIGEYLLEHFFDGDIEAVKSKMPGKTLSLRELAERDDIHMSRMDLWRAVHLAAQEKEIGAVPTSGQLSLSHKEVLLKVQDLDTKTKYMGIAVEEKLSVRQLENRVKEDGVMASNATDKDPEKAVILEYRRLDKAFDVISSFSPKTLKKMDAKTAQDALAKAEEAQKGLAKMIDALQKMTGVEVKKVA